MCQLLQPCRLCVISSQKCSSSRFIVETGRLAYVAARVGLAALPGGLPSTLNLVGGPSRTGDIEQSMELGAHGPKALIVLLMRA